MSRQFLNFIADNLASSACFFVQVREKPSIFSPNEFWTPSVASVVIGGKYAAVL
jgi:hypothetical protein